MIDTIHSPAEPKIVFKEGNRAVFEFSELHPGYGTTLGNALRRVLLSSIPGAAIVSAKIEGVQHEFSSIPNVLEDVIEISLNLKQVRVKISGESQEPQMLVLKAKGEKKVVAGDIKCPPLVEILNPDLHIATLTAKGAELVMELTAERGIGYVQAADVKREKLPIGVIHLDAIFTPVRKVNFEVENMRVGERTDYNKLRLDIETDGTVSPEESLDKACDILTSHFQALRINRSGVKSAVPVATQDEDDQSKELRHLGLGGRTINALQRNNILTRAQLESVSEEKLRGLKGLGEKGIEEIKRALGR